MILKKSVKLPLARPCRILTIGGLLRLDKNDDYRRMKDFDALLFLRRLMNVDSQTRNFDGVNRVQEKIKALLMEWGFNVELIAHPEGNSGHLLVATRDPDIDFRWINFLGHADTVLSSFPLIMGSDIWKGSGIADNKGGVVTLLQTLWNLKDLNLPFNYRVVISPNEETGSDGFHNYFKSWGQDAFLNLGFEPALENDELISSRNGNRWYEIKLDSLSAHAGRAMKGRLNLIHRASAFIQSLEHELKDEPKIKFNVTSIHTDNQKFNVIPENITIKLDARFGSFAQREKFHTLLETELYKMQLPCELTQTQVQSSYTIEDDCPPMGSSGDLEMGEVSYCFVHAGGAADINYFSHPHNYSIDGWGARGAQLHSKEEWLDTNSIFERAELLCRWLTVLAEYNTSITSYKAGAVSSKSQWENSNLDS